MGCLADVERFDVCAEICNATADDSDTCSLTEEPTAQSHLSIHFVRYLCGESRSFITALHGMQTRSSDENYVCPFVCPSVCLSSAWNVTKRKKDLSRFLYHTKDHLAFCHSGWRWTYNFRKVLFLSSSFPIWSKLTHPAARSLCNSWSSCFSLIVDFACEIYLETLLRRSTIHGTAPVPNVGINRISYSLTPQYPRCKIIWCRTSLFLCTVERSSC